MPVAPRNLTAAELKRFSARPAQCPLLRKRIDGLADYLAIISNAIRTDDPFWFRGHADLTWSLTPSALRHKEYAARVRALALIADFKRIADSKLPRPPHPDQGLMWAQIAQHYGLPTRLLDWTESATTALYFACLKEKLDGLVLILNPGDLNRLSYSGKPRVLDPQEDSNVIRDYLRAGARQAKRGRLPVAVNPVWNSERLIMQKGVFTLHGNRFDLDSGVPSLVAIPILRESKSRLRSELQRIGVDEMTMFPELEHACMHLKRKARLLKGENE